MWGWLREPWNHKNQFQEAIFGSVILSYPDILWLAGIASYICGCVGGLWIDWNWQWMIWLIISLNQMNSYWKSQGLHGDKVCGSWFNG